MKRFIKVFAIVLCLAMFTPLVVPNIGTETVNAASKIKLSKTKAEIPQGNKLAINLYSINSTSVKWSSSDKKIATINKKGVITGVAPGKATITAKYKNKSYKCKVTVKKLGIEYIDSEIVGDDGICNIVKYTNNSDYDVSLVISTNTYDEQGYVKYHSEKMFTCQKGGSVYYFYNKTYDKQTIIRAVQTKLTYGDFSKYVKTNSNINNGQLDITFENISNKNINVKYFILLYDENNNIVESHNYNHVSIPIGETAIRTVKYISSKAVRAEIFLAE